MQKVYRTLWNGGYGYQITIDGLHVKIHKLVVDETLHVPVVDALLFDAMVRNVFVGQSKSNTDLTKRSKLFGAELDGNSILIELSSQPLKYLFVREQMCVFQPESKIVRFESPMGFDYVSRPWAQDQEDNFYLFNANVVLSSKYKTHVKPPSDPTSFYYESGVGLVTKDLGPIPERLPMYPSVDGVSNYMIGGRRYTLSFEPDLAHHWKMHKELFKNRDTFVRRNSKKEKLTKKSFRKLMMKFSNVAGIKSMQLKTFQKSHQKLN